ncbi:hypothetical protein T4A_3226 [Trichinella pseudospiralis]|uniref:Uncharacterized protein n=2 Tax=Trichinella pseudospiralis TaxID=6337 RepID=A0A0V1DV88_TRIPS|nr:hypothetical protein T4A_3226 [Trichinella pseudospiralis]
MIQKNQDLSMVQIQILIHRTMILFIFNDMKIFIDLLMKMGILALQPFRFDAIANKITRNGFADILRFLYFNDNEHAMLDRRHLSCDQFYKVLPILEMYVNSCRKPEGQEKNSIDEAGCRMTFFYDRQQIEVEISSDFAPADVVLKLYERLPKYRNY